MDETHIVISEQPNLEYCPVDVLMEILAYLDCRDVVRLRQASRRLNVVSRLRSIWEKFASENASSLLQKRVDVSTSEELEAAVVQNAKGRKEILSAKTCVTTWSIDLNIPGESIVHLVPGGRWLLVNSPRFEGCVHYVDLDNPQSSWRQLIPPPPSDALFASFSLDQSFDTALSTFHLMHEVYRYLLPHEDDRSTMTRQITVWEIIPIFDSNGVVDGLVAERKSSFRFDQRAIVRDRTVQLQGQHLVFTGFRDSECNIVRWIDVDGCIDEFPGRTVRHLSCDFGRLLTERWLLVGCSRFYTLAIFDLSTVTETSSAAPHWARFTGSPTIHPLPPPSNSGSSVKQVLPCLTGFNLLDLSVSSDTGCLEVGYFGNEPCPRSLNSVFCNSRDIFTYVEKSEGAEIKFFDARTWDVCSAKTLSPTVFSIPPPIPSSWAIFLDAFSSRLLALDRGSDTIHICKFLQK